MAVVIGKTNNVSNAIIQNLFPVLQRLFIVVIVYLSEVISYNVS